MKQETKAVLNPSDFYKWNFEYNASAWMHFKALEVMLKDGSIVKSYGRIYLKDDFVCFGAYTLNKDGEEVDIVGKIHKWRGIIERSVHEN